jgi:hypothetical protein
MARTATPTPRRRVLSLALALLPATLAVALPLSAGAASSPVSSTWRGADPTSYDHSLGGGYWADSQASLNPYSLGWTCGDIVSYLLRLDVRDAATTTAARATIDMTSDSTGQSGVALIPITDGASIDATDPAQAGNGDSAITDFAAATSGTPLSSGATSTVAFTVTNLDASDSVIVRVNLRIVCNETATATGNVQAAVTSLTSLDGTVSYTSGAQTVPAKKTVPSSGTTTTTVPPTTTTTLPPVTTTTAPPVTTTTAPPVTTTTAPPVTTTTAPPVPFSTTTTTNPVIPDPLTTTTVPGPTSTTLPTDVLGEQLTTGDPAATTGPALATTGGSLRVALFGASACAVGAWFVAGSRRRRPAEG